MSRSRTRAPAILLALVGLGVVVTLLATHDLSRIVDALKLAGVDMPTVSRFSFPHVPGSAGTT